SPPPPPRLPRLRTPPSAGDTGLAIARHRHGKRRTALDSLTAGVGPPRLEGGSAAVGAVRAAGFVARGATQEACVTAADRGAQVRHARRRSPGACSGKRRCVGCEGGGDAASDTGSSTRLRGGPAARAYSGRAAAPV
ncbi:unnamed protein product, partial [Urochloa humidicola]